MATAQSYRGVAGHNPLNIIEQYAAGQSWDCDRLADDRLVIVVEGQWRVFTIALSWSIDDDLLLLSCSFVLDHEPDKELELLRVANHLNRICWSGSFGIDADEGLVTYRAGVERPTGDHALKAIVGVGLGNVVDFCDRCYPAFQMVNIGRSTSEEAVRIAMIEVAGNA